MVCVLIYCSFHVIEVSMDDQTLWMTLRLAVGIAAQVVIFLMVDQFLKRRKRVKKTLP
jgi:hypothetical protein